MTLPDCMMPDGAEPCKGYLELTKEVEHWKQSYERCNEKVCQLLEEKLRDRGQP